MKKHPEGKNGAAMIESCIVLLFLFLILFGLLQTSYMVAARDVLYFSSMATARSAQVGYNDFMLEKVARVSSIPMAGPIRNPKISGGSGALSASSPGELWDDAVSFGGGGGSSLQYSAERARIPAYLAAETPSQLRAILDYDFWQTSDTSVRVTPVTWGGWPRGTLLHVGVGQCVPMMMPYASAIADFIPYAVRVRVYSSEGRITVPAIEIASRITVEDHAYDYLGDSQ
jgi:hypothetical protein